MEPKADPVGRAYLDHASTSPLRPIAREAMLPWLAQAGDPGRVHDEGRVARVALEEAREQVGAFFGARPREVVFTSGATEALNMAIWGAAARARERTRGDEPRLVATAVEHSAVLEAAHRAGRALLVGVDGVGRVDPATLLAGVTPETALICVQLANHEVGTVQPVTEIAAAGRDLGVLTLVDAAMAAGHMPLDFGALGADLVAVTAHKLGGPAGIGALLVRRGLRLPPLILGGAQERARRAGLENVMAAAGFAAACTELAGPAPAADPAGATAGAPISRLLAEADAARAFTARIAAEATGKIEGVTLFGDPVDRIPHLVCLGVDGVEAEPVLLGLNQRGVAVHSGSSCSSETFEPSPVLAAMGVDADHSLRVSTGWPTTDADADAFLGALGVVVEHLRALR